MWCLNLSCSWQYIYPYIELPEKSANPNLHYWYLFIANFSPVVIQGWADQDKPKEKKDKKDKKDKKKEETKKEEDDDFDPFADEDAAPKPAAKPTPPPAAKAKKPKPIAKSIVIFEVKVYDMETNLDELAKKILKLEIDGLTWNNEPKKLPVAFGMYKLQMGCVIEDDKVLTDDIF